MKFFIIPVKFPHAHYLANYNLVLCASCSTRTAVAPVKPPELTVLLLAGSGSLRVRGSPVDVPRLLILRRTIVASTPPVAEPPQTLDVVLTRNGSARVLFPKNYALCPNAV